MGFGKTIPEWLWRSERRKGKRLEALPLEAYYWEGAESRPHAVKDISPTGMYLLTEDRWYVNTLVTMTLARTDRAEGTPNRSIRLMARVIRCGDDGVAFAFVWPGKVEELESALTSQKSVKAFVETFTASYRGNLAFLACRVVRSAHPDLLQASFSSVAVRPI
jgi:hypothetical protein